MRHLVRSFAFLLVASPLAAQGGAAYGGQGGAMQAGAAAAPAVGAMAPDFALPVVDKSGAKSAPLTLSKLKGQVVVLAFYPADFSSGCTIEMTKYRDEYKTLFGDGVIVLPISKDNIDSHTKWEVAMNFPFSLISDTSGVAAKAYGSNGARYFNRTTFVIGKDGKIAYSDMKFNANNQESYDKLVVAVKAAKAAPQP